MAGPPMMPGGGGGDLAAQLMQLAQSPQAQAIMASPKGQQMAQAIMSQMGGGGGGMAAMMGGGQNPAMGGQVPRAAATGMSPMGGDGTDGDISEAEGMLDQVSGGVRNAQQGPQTNYATGDQGPMPDPRQTPMPSTEDEMAMVQQQMGGGAPPQGGGGGMNSEGPTPQEVQMLQSSPTPRNIANFEKLFGPGSAQQVLAGGGGGVPSPTGGSTYEDDVKGAMDDAEGDSY